MDGIAAVWASSLLARLLKVIIEFLCRASPPCGILHCAHYEVDGEKERGKEKVGNVQFPFAMTLYETKK